MNVHQQLKAVIKTPFHIRTWYIPLFSIKISPVKHDARSMFHILRGIIGAS